MTRKVLLFEFSHHLVCIVFCISCLQNHKYFPSPLSRLIVLIAWLYQWFNIDNQPIICIHKVLHAMTVLEIAEFHVQQMKTAKTCDSRLSVKCLI